MSDDHPSFQMWPAMVCLGTSSLFLAIAAAFYWPLPELAFRSDNSPVSWLSSAQLWALSLISLRLTIDRTLPLAAGAWLSLAMTALAFDEQFMFHEHWKYGCHAWWDTCRYRWTTEAPSIAVGVVGTGTALLLHSLLPSRAARAILWQALAVGGLAITLDLFSWSNHLAPYEEGFEVIAEALFSGMLLGWTSPTRTHVHSP